MCEKVVTTKTTRKKTMRLRKSLLHKKRLTASATVAFNGDALDDDDVVTIHYCSRCRSTSSHSLASIREHFKLQQSTVVVSQVEAAGDMQPRTCSSTQWSSLLRCVSQAGWSFKETSSSHYRVNRVAAFPAATPQYWSSSRSHNNSFTHKIDKQQNHKARHTQNIHGS